MSSNNCYFMPHIISATLYTVFIQQLYDPGELDIDTVVKIGDTDYTMVDKGQLMLPLATGESIDVPVPSVVSCKEELKLFFLTLYKTATFLQTAFCKYN
eukprot:44943-Ditylum_brightwellii.AAC.1